MALVIIGFTHTSSNELSLYEPNGHADGKPKTNLVLTHFKIYQT